MFDLSQDNADNQVLLIDKPVGITSFDVIRSLRRYTGIRKFGHAGTLDPIASGLLICMSGSATKLSRHFMDMPKVYSGTLVLGAETPSFDTETEIIRSVSTDNILDDDVSAATKALTGTIIQVTPIYAAVKVGGKPLYSYARQGKDVSRPPRVVTVDEFNTGPREGDIVPFRIVCSTGTYVRTLVHDLGQSLGVGAHMASLRREAIGSYSVEDAIQLSDLQPEGE
ncbi:MAG: tRNA pseudouridine(55) synthase TruB [Rhodothermales bacterium]|nr:tRNA pseudouridine(55) synthase TruB [Rhodothermales bacterium]